MNREANRGSKKDEIRVFRSVQNTTKLIKNSAFRDESETVFS